MVNTGRTSRGRQRVALERMEKDSNRLVTFAKRRPGLFKKMSELVTLCRVQALCIVFSAANKAFAYGHPSVEAIIKRFLGENNNLPEDTRVSFEGFQNETLSRSSKEVAFLKDQIDMERKRGEEILKERTLKSEDAQRFLAPAENFTYAELKQIQATLIVLKNNVLTHGENLKMSLNPNPSSSTIDGQNSQEQNLNPPNLVQTNTTPTFGDSAHMTMVPRPLVMTNPNDNIPMAMRSNSVNTGFTHQNMPQAFQGSANLIPGSFVGQNTMPRDMGWNPMPGQTFTGFLGGEGSSNPQSGYMGSNPIPGNYQTFQNFLYLPPPSNPQGGYMVSNPIPGDYETFRRLMGEGNSNPPYPSSNPQGGFGPGMN